MARLLRAYSCGLDLPGTQPRGAVQVDWSHPITNGLSLVWNFSDTNYLPVFVGNGAYTNATRNSLGSLALTKAGIGLGSVLSHSAATYVLPQTTGTCVTYALMSWSPTDGVDYQTSNFGTSVGVFYNFRKFSDNNWYVGWQGGSDTRIVVAASGTFTAGEPFSSAITWNAANSSFYTQGILRGTNVSAPATGTTSGHNVGFCNGITAGLDTFYYVATWNRELSATELLTLQADPYCFLVSAEGEMPALFTSAAVAATQYAAFSIPQRDGGAYTQMIGY